MTSHRVYSRYHRYSGLYQCSYGSWWWNAGTCLCLAGRSHRLYLELFRRPYGCLGRRSRLTGSGETFISRCSWVYDHYGYLVFHRYYHGNAFEPHRFYHSRW